MNNKMSKSLYLIIFQLLIFAQHAYSEDIKGFYGRVDSGVSLPLKSGKESLKDNQLFGSLGVGYHFNDIFRSDINIQYRKFNGKERAFNYKDIQIPIDKNKVQNIAIMLNGYVNLTDSKDNFIPYITAGIGYGSNKLYESRRNVSDGYIAIKGKTSSNIIWSIGAGGVIKLTERFGIDLYYRYIDLGKLKSTQVADVPSISKLSEKDRSFRLRSNEVGVGIVFNF